MNILTGRYANDIIGLTLMLLMTVALIAAQAGALAHDTATVESAAAGNTHAASAPLREQNDTGMHAGDRG